MAKKEMTGMIKLQIPGGQATPAPPVGPALGQHGVNIGQFVKTFNDRTSDRPGLMLPVVISVYKDRSFDFIIKSPPAAVLLKRAAQLAKGANEPGREAAVGSVTRKDLEEIAKTKMEDLGASSLETAVRMIAGTARSCGIEVAG